MSWRAPSSLNRACLVMKWRGSLVQPHLQPRCNTYVVAYTQIHRPSSARTQTHTIHEVHEQALRRTPRNRTGGVDSKIKPERAANRGLQRRARAWVNRNLVGRGTRILPLISPRRLLLLSCWREPPVVLYLPYPPCLDTHPPVRICDPIVGHCLVRGAGAISAALVPPRSCSEVTEQQEKKISPEAIHTLVVVFFFIIFRHANLSHLINPSSGTCLSFSRIP